MGRDDRASAARHWAAERALVGQSPAFARMIAAIEQAAATSAPVLILGEAGTRTELVARAIHERSSRRAGPFIRLHCTANVDIMLDELFGHARGAFAGATTEKVGLLEGADGGTLFLDEVGVLDVVVQVYLLQMLYRPPDQTRLKRRRPEVRFMSSTGQDIPRMCREMQFRSDVLFMLSEATVPIPPLRARGREDIALLARYFLDICGTSTGRPVAGFTDEAVRMLAAYPWPGNEEELEHAVERAVLLASPGGAIGPEHLPGSLF